MCTKKKKIHIQINKLIYTKEHGHTKGNHVRIQSRGKRGKKEIIKITIQKKNDR